MMWVALNLNAKQERPKIMLLCSDKQRRDRFVHSFEAEGFQVSTLTNSVSLYKQIHAFRPHMVLIDLNNEFAKQLQSDISNVHQILATPFFVITDSSDNDYLQSLFEIGVVDYVAKNISWPILFKKIDLHMERYLQGPVNTQGDVRFKAIFEHAANGMALISMRGGILEKNGSFDFIIGNCNKQESDFGRQLITSQKENPSFRMLREGNIDAFIAECQLKRCSGEQFCARIIFSAIRKDRLHKPESVLITVEDITLEKQKAVRLQLAAAVFDTASEAIIITDADVNILEVNNAFSRLTGYSREEVLGKNPKILQSGRQDATFYQAMWQTLQTEGKWQGEIWNRRKNGEIYPEMLSINAVYDDDLKVANYVAVFSDITHIKDSERRLTYLAQHDPLTDLPNRMLLNDRLEHALAFAHRNQLQLAVLYVDLNGFKQINDRYGHAVGDSVLEEVSKRLEQTIRENDTIARVGGDEFIVLLEYIEGRDDIDVVLEKIETALCRPVRVNDDILQIGASIGVSIYPQDAPNKDKLFSMADKAMYRAKQQGKTTHIYWQDIQQQDAG
jgi:diguanylate cyclase (GGDEF)-like protein/PAS domain S-box-containing protein